MALEKSGQLLEQNIAHLNPRTQEDARLDFQAGLIGADLSLTEKGQFEVNLASYPVEEDKEDLRDYFGRGFVDRDLQFTRRGKLYTSDLDTVLAQGELAWMEWVEMGAWDEHKEQSGEDPFLKQVGGAVKSLVTEVVPEAAVYGSTGVMASTPLIKAADWVGSLGIPEGVPFLGAFTEMHEARKDAKLSVTELQRETRKELAAGWGAAARAGMENQVVLDKGRQLLQTKAQAGITGAIAGLFDGGLGDADKAVLMALYDYENSKRLLREASANEAAGALASLAALGASEAERMERAEFAVETSRAARAGRTKGELAAIDKEAASYGMLGLDPSFPLTPAASLSGKGARALGLQMGKPLKMPGLGVLGRTTLKATDDAAKHLAALTARRAAIAKSAAREGAAPVVPGAGAGTAATPRPGLKTTGKRAGRRTARHEVYARNLQRLDDEILTAKKTLERHTARLGGVGALVKDGVRQVGKNLHDRYKKSRFGSWATETGGWVDETLANLGRGKQAQLSGAVGSAFTGLGYFGLATGNPFGLLLLAPRTWSQQYRVLRGATQMINAAGAEFFRRRVTMPYWQRVSERVAENPWAANSASILDAFAKPLTPVVKATGNVGSAIARSTAAEIPFSAMATGGEEGWLVEAAAEGITFGVPGQLQGLIHGLGGAPARLKKHEFDLLAQNDVAELRRNLSLGQREIFDALDPVVKRQVGVYSALFPDVTFQFIPGSGGGAYREKTKTLIIDPQSKNPLDVMLAHEIGHSLAARGMKEKIYAELVGPGGLLRDKDGNLTKEAKAFKKEYENRLNRGRPPKEPRLELSDQRLAEEWFAEAVAPGLQKSQKLQQLVRRNKLITGLAEAILPRVPFGKAMLLRRGVLLDENGHLAKGQGAMVSANLSPALARLADAYLRNNAGSRFVPKGKQVPGTQKVVGGRTIEDLHRKAIYTREDMDRMEERNMIDYERNPDGSVKRDRFGRAKGLEPSVLAAQETTIGNIIRKVAEKYGVVPLTQKRGGDRFDNLTREQWDEILEEIRKTRLYNDHQIAAMRSAFRGMADNDGKAHRFQYQKALDTNEKTGKKRYKPKPQEDRVGSIYSIEVTKANNVIVKVIDMDALEERAIKASQSKDAPAMYRDNSADIMRDLMILAENHNKPDMNNVDVFGEERARFLNGVLGQLSKEHAFNNPTVKGGRPPIRSFRLDRANFVYNTNEDGLTFNHHQWVQGLMPEPVDATTQQSDAARQDTINRLPEADPGTGAQEGGLPTSGRRGVGGDQGWVPAQDSPYPPATRPPLDGLPQTVKVDGKPVIFGPFQPARQAAEDYMAGAGLEYNPPTTYEKVDRERATRIADEYERMPHAPNDPEVREAYRAMIDETLAQYEAIKATGLVVEPNPPNTDPYGNPRNAILDVVENNHMWFFPTNEGFGGDAVSDVDVAENPLLEETGEVINGYRMTANDVFRVVHDYFGHIKEGNGFRAGGEENAWRAHSAMYSPKARRAMTSETRGQNSWVNYGPHGEFNRTASGADTEYAAQKTGLLPEWVTEEGAGDDIRRMPEQLTVYHGGTFGADRHGGLLFTSPDRSQAEAYAKEEGAPVNQFDINLATIATDGQAFQAMEDLGLAPLDPALAEAVARREGLIYEYLDDSFEYRLGASQRARLVAELKRRGCTGIKTRGQDVRPTGTGRQTATEYILFETPSDDIRRMPEPVDNTGRAMPKDVTITQAVDSFTGEVSSLLEPWVQANKKYKQIERDEPFAQTEDGESALEVAGIKTREASIEADVKLANSFQDFFKKFDYKITSLNTASPSSFYYETMLDDGATVADKLEARDPELLEAVREQSFAKIRFSDHPQLSRMHETPDLNVTYDDVDAFEYEFELLFRDLADPQASLEAGKVVKFGDRLNPESDDIRRMPEPTGFQPSLQAPSGVKTEATNTTLPNFSPRKIKSSLAKNVLTANLESFESRLDRAGEKVAADPARLADPKGYVEYMRDTGVWGPVLTPPTTIGLIADNPAGYVDYITTAHQELGVEGGMQAAQEGLDSTVQMREAIGNKPDPWIAALHHLWGILSRQLPPVQQEALWLRLMTSDEVLAAIQSSIDGNFTGSDFHARWAQKTGANQRQSIVGAAIADTADGSEKLGNQGTANANAYEMMLNRWDGKWDQVSDVYSADKSAIEMGRAFWGLGQGPVGIKNKVQRFIGLTYGTPGVILDRWQYVHLWLPSLIAQSGKASPRKYFSYGQKVPRDPASLYSDYGTIESAAPSMSLALYEGIETALNTLISQSPDLQQFLGRHANVGGFHWNTWNLIKNEAVGHSSLNLTYDLANATVGRRATAQDVSNLVKNGSYFTEGKETNTRTARFTLDRGRPVVTRSGGLPDGQ